MEQEKPFKTVEVLDSRTRQICKVACLSCIRGHRTTSCGIPVCRNKVFWTVKRPGRPSNSCTCRYNGGGGCKCVIAKSACPHKSRKGEKRSGECRCDEVGRFCCLLEPEHWDVLLALQKPTVEFFATREALEAKQMASTSMTYPHTPAYSAGSSAALASVPSTPGPYPSQSVPSPFNGLQSPSSTPLTPRFGMMGIGGPQGNDVHPPDLLAWQGQSPQAPLQYHPQQPYQQEEQSCCLGPASPGPSVQRDEYMVLNGLEGTMDHGLLAGLIPPASAPVPSPFDFNKMTTDYFQYQLPSAICQNCGLSGCTCRSCPPVLQASNGSWAQCCGRKHAMAVVPPDAPMAPTSTKKLSNITTTAASCCTSTLQPESIGHSVPPLGGEEPDFSEFDFDQDFSMAEGTQPMDLSDFLMSELEGPKDDRGCCCGDP